MAGWQGMVGLGSGTAARNEYGGETVKYPPSTASPAQREKDESVAIARRVLQNNSGVTREESTIMARQLLRALALTP